MNSESNIQMRAIAEGTAEISSKCCVKITNGNVDAKTALDQVGILLDDESKIQFDPILEISDNRLEASHSATISSPDEMQLYYLMSRGLTIGEAKKVIISGLLHIPEKYIRMG